MVFQGFTRILLCCFCVGIALSAQVSKSKARFDNYKVLRVQIPDEKARNYIANPDHEVLYNVWAEPRINYTADIMIAPEKLREVTDGLNSNGLEYSTMIEDVQMLIELESTPITTEKDRSADHPMTWTEYHSQDDMEAYMDYLVETYPDLVSIDDIGTSYEGRPMRVLKICKGGSCGQKPAMWIDGGIHAREWISPAVTTFHMKELVENSENYPSDLLDKLDWYILPVHNPDGYEYTRTDNRMWRKNRTPNSGSQCMGTDMNRNYPYHWNDGGSSSNPCSDTYMGKAGGSEPAVQNVMNYVSKIKDNIKFYQSLHSYSQLILMPWGFTYEHCPDYDKMLDLGNRGNEALHATHSKNYDVGSIPGLLYIASGNAVDYAKGELEVPYVYTIELRDTGAYGFLLPPEQITPCAEEIVAFHVVAAQQVIAEFAS